MNEILVSAIIVLLPLTAIFLFFFMVSKYAAFRRNCIFVSKYLSFIFFILTSIMLTHTIKYGASKESYYEFKIAIALISAISVMIWSASSVINQDKETEGTWRKHIK